MVYQYVLGGVLVSLLGSVFFMIINSTLSGKKKAEDVSEDVNGNGFVRTQPANGGCLPEIEKSTDVVIVGAGVAGAALAYTLGKVIINSLSKDHHNEQHGFQIFPKFKSFYFYFHEFRILVVNGVLFGDRENQRNFFKKLHFIAVHRRRSH